MTDNAKERLRVLADEYLKGTISESGRTELEAWFRQQHDKPLDIPSDFAEDEEALERRIFSAIQERTSRYHQTRKAPLWPRIAAAASIVLALSAGGYFALHRRQPVQQVARLTPGLFKNDAVAGNKAILTLANGQQLAVTALAVGAIQHTSIQKTRNGALVYSQSSEAPDVYNTLTVPRGGGKHELKLADGTLAILDAGSSIRFPVAFNGKERRVSVTGQVYFEVVHKTEQPFFVTVANETIADIGTHFNINAFDHTIKTTLIEGSVKVNNTLLKPGQQAVESANGTINVLGNVDEEEVLAWKNDLFKFGDDASLQTIMNQLGRWYDLDIVYEGPGKPHRFGGVISRDLKLSSVCKILSLSGVQFALDGKKIIVYQ